jgi:hypothetical protein
MSRQQAIETAAARFTALNAALMNFWLGRGEQPNEAEYGYRHGWFLIDGHSISTQEFAPSNQPYMD